MIKYSLVVCLFSICIKYASSIRCYECNSVNNSMCIEPTEYDQETLHHYMTSTNCGHGVYSTGDHQFFCRKIVQTILHKGYEPEVRVTRGCGWVRHKRDCYKADNEDHLETVCQCFSDDCNAGAMVKYSAWSILTTLALVLWSMK